MRPLASAVLAMVCGLLPVAAAVAADTDRLVKIYMEELTRETKVPSKLAARLVAEAEKVTDKPPLQIGLYRKAYEYGMRTPAGYESARKAARVLLAISPNAKPEWANKLARACQLIYAGKSRADKKAFAAKLVTVLVLAGDVCLREDSHVEATKFYRRAAVFAKDMDADVKEHISERILRTQASKRIWAKFEALKKRLKDNPTDAETRMALIRCCVVERDRPADAAAQRDASVPAAWRTNVGRALKNRSALDEAACFELGSWYGTLGKDTGVPQARQRMYERAATYLRRFLDLHTSEDALFRKAETLLRSIGVGQYTWTDLLKIASSSRGGSYRTVPLLPLGSYELRLRFVWESKRDSIDVYFPLGGGQGYLKLKKSDSSHLYGLSAHGGTEWKATLKTDVEQTLEIKVVPGTKTVTVSARLDGGAWHRWKGAASSVSGPMLRLPGSDSDVDLRSVELRMLSAVE